MRDPDGVRDRSDVGDRDTEDVSVGADDRVKDVEMDTSCDSVVDVDLVGLFESDILRLLVFDSVRDRVGCTLTVVDLVDCLEKDLLTEIAPLKLLDPEG